ncbi:MAG: hypothetical protein JXA30_01655 [Deltaproteobacteria bacterium]|nr:hypothetical protein [Deltaproteobacteria bacterium]
MIRPHVLVGTFALTLVAFGAGCRDYPDSGPLVVELYWEVPPPSEDARASDAGAPDADEAEPGSFDECEKAGVVRFDYRLGDMSDCARYSNGWACPYFDEGERITCDRITVLDFGWIEGGDYFLNLWGYDKDGLERWDVSCEDLYVNGKETPQYVCEIPYFPEPDEKRK